MLRSAAKPLQALPAVRDGVVERYDLEARHVAVACGSHEGTPAHAATVAEVIARAGLSVADLRPRGVHPPLAAAAARALALAGRTPTVLEHNCSGNHALMLLREVHARTRSRRLPRPGRPGAGRRHRRRRAGLRLRARDRGRSLRHARVFACRCATPRSATSAWPATACRSPTARPRRVSRARCARRRRWSPGPGRSTRSRTRLPHVVAKRGALGVFCCASAQTGRGGALKVEDGSFEAMEIAALHLLEAVAGPLGEDFDPWRERVIGDGNGAPVGVWSAHDAMPVL